MTLGVEPPSIELKLNFWIFGVEPVRLLGVTALDLFGVSFTADLIGVDCFTDGELLDTIDVLSNVLLSVSLGGLESLAVHVAERI